MKKIIIALFAVLCFTSCDLSKYQLVNDYDFETVFEKSGGTETASYNQVIDYYKDLDAAFTTIHLVEYGKTDSGLPLHLAVFSSSEEFDFDKLRKDNSIVLINNGIHPGESDGIDATMMLFRDLAEDSIPVPKNTVIATIPVYNIGGALNRNSHTRVNQDGPKEYGFRGNARNYDLDRDFIKADTKNTRSFAKIFHAVDPDIFIDTHVSNGADYQYSLTHLFTQHDKLGGQLGTYVKDSLMPSLKASLFEHEWEITPYVNVFNELPENGFSQFMDYPRYSTGYTTLWNTLGLMVETHMLKPYKKRVLGTYQTLKSLIDIAERDRVKIKKLRAQADKRYLTSRYYPTHFVVDSSKVDKLQFKGYEGEMINSGVTGAKRLKYDRSKPFTKEVDYYDNFKPTAQIEIPKAYIIPQGWWNVVDILKSNNVEMTPLKQDTTIAVQVYHIKDYKTSPSAYEGHYLHSNTSVTTTLDTVSFRKGDLYISTLQRGVRYLVETLEPTTSDSFFNWNFFDTVLQQKEGFSPYVFEDLAKEILDKNPDLKKELEQKKKEVKEFNNNWYAQLEWIRTKSEYNDPAYLRYPIFRVSR